MNFFACIEKLMCSFWSVRIKADHDGVKEERNERRAPPRDYWYGTIVGLHVKAPEGGEVNHNLVVG